MIGVPVLKFVSLLTLKLVRIIVRGMMASVNYLPILVFLKLFVLDLGQHLSDTPRSRLRRWSRWGRPSADVCRMFQLTFAGLKAYERG